jgi:hypothetical protein
MSMTWFCPCCGEEYEYRDVRPPKQKDTPDYWRKRYLIERRETVLLRRRLKVALQYMSYLSGLNLKGKTNETW